MSLTGRLATVMGLGGAGCGEGWRLRAVFVLLPLLGCLNAPGAAPWAAQRDERLDRGQELIRDKRYAEALLLLGQIKEDHPNLPEPFFYSALALIETGQLRQAGAELREAIQRGPARPEYAVLYAEVLYRLGSRISAAEALDRVEEASYLSKLEPKELSLLADLYFRLGKLEKSLKVLDRYASVQPDDAAVTLRKGQILLEKGAWEEARQMFQEALATPSQRFPANFGLGMAHWKEGHLAESKTFFQRALDLQPGNQEVLYHLGLVSLQANDTESALVYLNQIERTGERYPPVYNALARAYRRMGDSTRSRAYLEKFRKAQLTQFQHNEGTKRADALVRQGLEKLQQSQVDEARRLFSKALGEDSRNWVAHKYLARILISSRRWQEAYPHLTAMEEAQPEAYDLLRLMAEYWYQIGEAVKAGGYAEKARSVRPGDAELRNLLGNIYFLLGRRRDALVEYEAAVRLDPQRKDFLLNYQSLLKKP
ncbi:MAG: tetratricopeptide repeat protein [Acidobacteriota bacterium]